MWAGIMDCDGIWEKKEGHDVLCPSEEKQDC